MEMVAGQGAGMWGGRVHGGTGVWGGGLEREGAVEGWETEG